MKQIKLTRKQFDVLSLMERNKAPFTQREVAEALGYALGSINQIFQVLTDSECIHYGMITRKGSSLLESYRVDRAIILADEFKVRLMPRSIKEPVSYMTIHKESLIERQIEAILGAGITNIYVVCGYLKERFFDLTKKYPFVTLIENPLFLETNTITSLLCVSHLLENAYVIEGDCFIDAPSVIEPYQYESNFLGIPTNRCDTWCFLTDKKKICAHKMGGEVIQDKGDLARIRLYQKVGISYWTKKDGMRLAGHLKEAYLLPGAKEMCWEHVPFSFFKSEYQIRVRECKSTDAIKIDSLKRLKEMNT